MKNECQLKQINFVQYLSILNISLWGKLVQFSKNCFLKIRYNFLLLLLVVSLCNLGVVSNARADSFLDDMLNVLNGLSCETEGVGDLLRSEFSHTCVPAPFATFAIANIISPGLYAIAFLRLSINDDHLFPDACDRGNRIEFDDQRLSFSLCNNSLLAAERFKLIGNLVVQMAKAIWNGTSIKDSFSGGWKIPKKDYHSKYKNKKKGSSGMLIDFLDVAGTPVPFIVPWKVIRDDDKLCVATRTLAWTWIPVGCKYIKEPFPTSRYADFMSLGSGVLEDLSTENSLTSCGNMGSCYKRAYNNSRTPIVMTGPIIECVKEMIAKLMISSSVCSFDDMSQVLGSISRESSSLFQFQQNMHKIVSALLTIYVILFGFKIILAGDMPQKSELINFVLKFIFVVYFSVGINITAGSGDDLNRMDGMVEWAFPFLLNGMNQLASWLMNASASGLCNFSDVTYPDSLQHLQLWDSLDCKISHYLGLDAVQTMIVENASRNNDFKKFDFLSFPIPPYIYMLIPAIYSGITTLVLLVIMYPLLVISVAAFMVNAVVVCMISIVVLGVLAPLFVPLLLFEYTRGYFDAWVKLLISFLLQPMIAAAFMTVMFSVYDLGFYGTCKYTHKDFTYKGADFDVSMSIGTVAGGLGTPDQRGIRYSYLDQDWDKYTKEEEEGCRQSLGFIFNNPFQFLYSTGDSLGKDAVMPWLNDASGSKNKERFDFLEAIKDSPGMFFNMVEVIFEQIKIMVVAMFTACFMLYLMYHFSANLAEFTADMTEGVVIGNMAIKPQALFNDGMAATKAAMGAANDKQSTGSGESSDKQSTAGGASSDKMSTGRGGASDKMSTGSGGSSDKMSTGDKK